MADGVCLLVDAFEGPMPQTRFVLGKALSMGLKPLVVVNKVDKENCTPDEVHEKVFDLMFELDANEDQLDFPTMYGSAKNNWMAEDWKSPSGSIVPLLDKILEYYPPVTIPEGNTQMLITSLDFSSFVGRIAIGRLTRGELKPNMPIILSKADGTQQKHRIKDVFTFEGTDRVKVDAVQGGDICAITGIEGFEIGDSICDVENPEPLESIAIDEPTMSMLFSINDSPFFGKEGKLVTSRHISERLDKELEKNLAMRVQKTDKADKWMVFGRGVMHLSVLIETMRREGYELQVGQPQVIIKEIDGKKCEPVEELTIDLPEVNIEYQPYKGEIPGRLNGSLISMELGTSIPFSLNNLQERGTFFIAPGESIYEGQVIGENSRANDLVVNVTKTKKMSNMRSSGADDKVKLAPPKQFSLEECLEYIQSDEYVEVTPENLRMRKILLKETDRKRSGK